jgi:hypothetical protein
MTNQELFKIRASNRAKITTPVVGDFIKMPDGSLHRIAHVWSDNSVQPTIIGPGNINSFFMYENGYSSYSGGLKQSVSIDSTPIGAKHGIFWMFDLNIPGAGRGVDFEVRVNIWQATG